ncbi:PorV/PorQ family protein [candidate division KSB1 bacterium]|nr:PorV/PorQ family protein [candidate division KSB1 bacterium]
MKLTMLLILLLTCVNHADAQDGLAGMPGAYLHMGVGARALGMGKAYTALANDASAIYWNPAGICAQEKFQLYLTHSQLFMDTNFDYFAAVAPTEQFGNIGFGVLALSSGEFEQRTVLNENVGQFKMMDMAFLLSWAKEVGYGFSVGGSYKLVSQKIMNVSGIGHGIDLGVKRRLFDRFEIGMAITNALMPNVTLVEQAQKYPMQMRMGVAVPLLNNQLMLSTDVGQIVGWGKMTLDIGVEYLPINRLALRTGMENGRFTFGLGFSFQDYGVDYSSSSVNDLGYNHRFAVKYTFGGFGINAIASPDVFSPTGEINLSHIKLHAKSRQPIARWEFSILNTTGDIIRHFTADGAIPEEIIWDGRDNRGILVEDGNFNYRFEVVTINGKNLTNEGGLVTIDTRGPEGSLGLNEVVK